MDEYRVLTGIAKEVENELNALNKKNYLFIGGISTTNEQTTIIVQVMGERE